MKENTAYIDLWGYHQSRETIYINQDAASAKVTYRGDDGSRFRVIVHKKSNPIGFAARLPGDPKR